MPTPTEIPSQASWPQDRPDSPHPPTPEAPYFDDALQAWVFSRYSDVVAAMRNPLLSPVGLASSKTPSPLSDKQRHAMRSETLAILSASQLRLWKKQALHHAEQLLTLLPQDRPIDLLGEYARPVCLSLATTVTGVRHDDPQQLCPHARALSLSSADPYNPDLRAQAKSASATLQPYFPPGPETLRSSGFVALTQTLPFLLGNAWFALLQHPHEWDRLHHDPHLIESAVHELIRFAGLTRVLARQATADLHLHGAHIRKDQRVILRLTAANKDSEIFDHPGNLNITRPTTKHLSFGAGRHACTGAGLLRMMAIATTAPLVSRFSAAPLARNVEWQGGATFLAPRALWVHLRS
ncbi:MAG TPA: cytochrome P450 [Edaphobacter sp.]|jgi:cytochrome P450|nr:cytochrome P450 [Edaphobacter sp.]